MHHQEYKTGPDFFFTTSLDCSVMTTAGGPFCHTVVCCNVNARPEGLSTIVPHKNKENCRLNLKETWTDVRQYLQHVFFDS